MKSKIYFLFFLIFISSAYLDAQRQTLFGGQFNEWVAQPCNLGPKEYTVTVSGLPTAGWTLDFFHMQTDFVGGGDAIVYVVSPGGSLFYVGRTADGSFPGENGEGINELHYIKDCSSIPAHDAPSLVGPNGEFFNRPQDPFPDFSSQDVNGDWKIYTCSPGGVGDIWMSYIELAFTSVNPSVDFYDLNLAPDCQSRTDFVAQVALPPCETGFTFNETNGYSSNNSDQYSLSLPWSVVNIQLSRFPNIYYFNVIGDNGGGVSTDYHVQPANYSTAGGVINCPADVTVSLGSHDIVQPTFMRNCDFFVTMNLDIVDPNGNVAQTYSPWNTLDWYNGIDVPFDYSMNGTYDMNWNLLLDEADNIGNPYWLQCQQRITVDNNMPVIISSPICGGTPVDVTNCITINDSQFHPVTVSGQPSALTPEYGITGVWVDLDITNFNTQLPYVDIVDPTGFRHRLFNPWSFPQFNGNTQDLKVFFTACNTAGVARAGDDVPFVEGGTYRPMSGTLNVANQRGIDPNGVWQLQTCGTAVTWKINCFELEFGPMCASLNNWTFGEENCETFIQVKGADITDLLCDDMNEDGLPDYYISIDGGTAVTWDPADHLKTVISPGMHNLEFGELQYDENGNAIFACRQFFNINAPAPSPDTQDPMLTNCPPNQSVQLGSNGQITFDVTNPGATDNCGVASIRAKIYYENGTTDGGGSTGLVYDGIASPGTYPYTAIGAGTVRFDWEAIDDSGNTGTCQTIVTVNGADPCTNDTQDPVLTNCPADFSIQIQSDGSSTAMALTPDVSDNCAVTSTVLDATWSNGATAQSGTTSITNFPYPPGQVGFDILSNGAGTVTVIWKALDAAGNEGSCQTIITLTGSGDPCNNDTQDPTFIDCPSDQTIVLDASGIGSMNVTDPGFSDNCTIVDESHTITYSGGATNGSGGTLDSWDFINPGANYTYGIVGAGIAEFKYEVTDQAGNKATCVAIITAKDPTGPCNNDVTDPVLTNCQQNSTVTLDNSNMAMIDIVAPAASDNCGIQTRSVQVTYSGGATDEFGNTTRSFVNFSNGGSRTFTIIGAGTLSAEFSVSDPFGNTASCTTTITAIFGGTDVIFNPAEECIVPGGRLSLPVRVTNFTDIGAFSFDLTVPSGSGLSFVGLENENITNSSFNVLGNGDLRVAWDEPSGNDLTLPNNTRIFNVVLAADASFNAPAVMSGIDVVILQQGIPVMGRVDIATICVGSGVTPKGRIYSPLNKAHAGVAVNLVSGSNSVANVNSDAQGNYGFATTNSTFRITPSKNDEVRKGITISDVARIRRHFLQKLTLDTDYKIVAADVNKDGKINVIDVAFTNRVFLKKLDEFPGNTAWRFVPVAADISKNPLNVNIPNRIDLNQSGLDFDNLDFYSIKTGDVDHSSLVRGGKGGVNRIDVSVTVPDTVLSPAEMVEIPVYLSGSDKLSAMSMVMSYDSDVLELVSISAPNLPSFGGGSYNDIDGEVLIGWDHPQGEDVDAEGMFMVLSFMSKVEEGSSDISLSEASFFDINLDEIGVNAQSGSVTFMTSNVFDLNSNVSIDAYPNPFTDRLNMEFELNKPQPLTITMRDAAGKVIKTIDIEKASTNEKLMIDNIDHQGIIIINVKGQEFTETLKVMKL